MDGSEVSQCQSTSSHVSQGLKYLGWLKPFRHSNIQFKGGTKQCPEEKVLRKNEFQKLSKPLDRSLSLSAQLRRFIAHVARRMGD